MGYGKPPCELGDRCFAVGLDRISYGSQTGAPQLASTFKLTNRKQIPQWRYPTNTVQRGKVCRPTPKNASGFQSRGRQSGLIDHRSGAGRESGAGDGIGPTLIGLGVEHGMAIGKQWSPRTRGNHAEMGLPGHGGPESSLDISPRSSVSRISQVTYQVPDHHLRWARAGRVIYPCPELTV